MRMPTYSSSVVPAALSEDSEGFKATWFEILWGCFCCLQKKFCFCFVFLLREEKKMEFWGLPMLIIVAVGVGVEVAANSEGDALYALRRNLHDPLNVLQSWDPTLVNPCTWFHVTCDRQNRVTRLDLGNARLSGTLVGDLGKLTSLQYLELYKNNIRGEIPKELGNLKSLISLDLYQNNLTGKIPASLGDLKSLRFLRLNGNKLTGRIPRRLTNLSSLKILDVSDNDLCGTIPVSGAFSKFSQKSFENNQRLKGPELIGSVVYNLGCSYP